MKMNRWLSIGSLVNYRVNAQGSIFSQHRVPPTGQNPKVVQLFCWCRMPLKLLTKFPTASAVLWDLYWCCAWTVLVNSVLQPERQFSDTCISVGKLSDSHNVRRCMWHNNGCGLLLQLDAEFKDAGHWWKQLTQHMFKKKLSIFVDSFCSPMTHTSPWHHQVI